MAVEIDDDSEKFRERLINGDQEALAELFAQQRQRLSRIVHFRIDKRILGRVDPEDILQDAFVDASKRLAHYSEQKKFSPFVWIRMMVGQTLIDVHRRHLAAQQRDAGREISIDRNPFPQSTSVCIADFLSAHITTPSMIVGRKEQQVKLHEAVESMDEIDREVLALRHFEELSNKEVAEVLAITQKTASIRYVRAIARLKTVLADVPDLADLSGLADKNPG